MGLLRSFLSPSFSACVHCRFQRGQGGTRGAVWQSRRPNWAQAPPSTAEHMSGTSQQPALWSKILDTYEKAQQSGAASKFKTNTQIVIDPHLPIKFVLRVSDSLRDKPKPPKSSEQQKEWKDPFAPYEEALWVEHLSETHTLLLNKFNVVPHHVLVVTKEFQDQSDHLNLQDLEATWQVVQAVPQGALAYFNCGPESGASQPHKHIQIVPLPLADDPSVIPSPLAVLMDQTWRGNGLCEGDIGSLQELPYQNYFSKLSLGMQATQLVSLYQKLLQECSVRGEVMSYNLIFSKTHMVLVPRRQETVGSVAINSLGFAGTLLISSKAGLEDIHRKGPIAILEAAGVPW